MVSPFLINKQLKAIAEDLWLTQIRNYVPSAWLGHAPFLKFLVREIKPNIFVELGTHNGFSYFVGCQTVQELGLSTTTYAVDHWLGDAHAGEFDASVYKGALELNEQYKDFSTLLKMSFLEAREEFSESLVDLLHIDGFHTYDAVKEDFETWLPKMSKSGVVILHDIHVRHADFGVFQYWLELKQKYETIEFVGSYGLGVVFLNAPESSLLQAFITMAKQNNDAQFQGVFGALSEVVLQKYYSLEVNKNVEARKKIEYELEQIRKSTSWLVTKPLRKISVLIKRRTN